MVKQQMFYHIWYSLLKAYKKKVEISELLYLITTSKLQAICQANISEKHKMEGNIIQVLYELGLLKDLLL